MPRLRVTAVLSLLALLVGIGGTGWLSTFTDDWVGPPPVQHAAALPQHHPDAGSRRHAPPRVVGALADASPYAATTIPPLVPVSTPPGSASWAQLRGHLDGHVVLAVATDGEGQVRSAAVAQSSGDPVLDAHAVATVRRWRFAVPAGFPDGVHGELPMRFSSAAHATPP